MPDKTSTTVAARVTMGVRLNLNTLASLPIYQIDEALKEELKKAQDSLKMCYVRLKTIGG